MANRPDQIPTYVEGGSMLLAALCNPIRLLILTIISSEEVSVGVLSEMIGLSQSATSQHLARLRGVGVVSMRRDMQTVYYSCLSESAKDILALLDGFFPADQAPLKAA